MLIVRYDMTYYTASNIISYIILGLFKYYASVLLGPLSRTLVSTAGSKKDFSPRKIVGPKINCGSKKMLVPKIVWF